MTFLVMAPGVEIITLTRDMALSRQEEIDYLNKHGFAADFAKLKYSYNVGLWGTSICGGEILDSAQGLPESAYLKHCTKEGSEQLRLTFEKGELKAVNDEKIRRSHQGYSESRGNRCGLRHRTRYARRRHDYRH